MPTYFNASPEASIQSVEFATVNGANTCFFQLTPPATQADVTAMLQRAGVPQTILSETKTNDRSLVVTQGSASADQVLYALAKQGQHFAPPAPEDAKFNPWAWRGITSVIGQSLQIASSYVSKGATADRVAIFGFASLNLLANFINIVFGAQKKEDKHQLHALKERFNQQLAPYVAPGALPNPDDKRLDHYSTMEPGASFGQQTANVVQKYSVSAGEIGLRTVGSVSLAFPLNQWKNAASVMKETGSLTERLGKAVSAARNSNIKTFRVGLAMLTGKFVSFLAKEPDPYNPKPPSFIDTIREKVMFKLSSAIEGGAATYMAWDRYNNQKITLRGKEFADHFGGLGNVVFVGGYMIRYTAPYGSLEVNMPELYAHVTDGIAKLPPEKIPAMVATAATDLKAHFKDKPLTVSSIYAALAEDLQKHHGITLKSTAPAPALIAEITPERPGTLMQTVAHHERIEAPAQAAAVNLPA